MTSGVGGGQRLQDEMGEALFGVVGNGADVDAIMQLLTPFAAAVEVSVVERAAAAIDVELSALRTAHNDAGLHSYSPYNQGYRDGLMVARSLVPSPWGHGLRATQSRVWSSPSPVEEPK